jgi:hypothetical protein
MGNLEKNQKKKHFPLFSCFQDREHRLKLFRFHGQARGGWVQGRGSRFDSEVRRSEKKRTEKNKKKLEDAFVSRV